MSKEAVDRLRERAQNEQTSIALNDYCKTIEVERDRLAAELAHVRQANANYRKENQIAVDENAELLKALEYCAADLHPMMQSRQLVARAALAKVKESNK